MNVYVAQLLCPARHCIIAFAEEIEIGEPPFRDLTVEESGAIQDRLREQLATTNADPFCGICLALVHTWRIDVQITPWKSLTEATPHLRAAEEQQAQTREAFQDRRKKARKAGSN